MQTFSFQKTLLPGADVLLYTGTPDNEGFTILLITSMSFQNAQLQLLSLVKLCYTLTKCREELDDSAKTGRHNKTTLFPSPRNSQLHH